MSQKVLRDPSNIIACVPNFDVSSDNKMEHNFAYFEMPIDEEENVDKMKSPEKVQVNGTHKFNTSSSNSNGTRQNSSTQGSSNNGNDTRTGNNGNHNKKFRNASQGNFYDGDNNGNEDSSHGFTSDSDEDMDGQEKFEKEKLEKEVEQMKLQNATLKDTVSATTELSDRLKSMNDELQKADEKKSIELQRSLQYIRDPDKLRERDQREKINLAMKVDQLKKQAQIENDKLKTQLQATHDETQVTNKKLNDALLNQSNENDKLRNELKAKEEKVMLLKKSMETEKEEFLSKLRSSYNDAKSMHDKMNDAIKAKDVENDHLRNQLNSNFEETKSMHDTMNQALMSKDIENDNLTKALQETMAKLHSAEERLKSTKMYATGLERSIEHDSNEFGNVPKSTSGSKRKKNRNGSSTMAFEVATTVEKDLIVFTPEKEELKDNTNKEIHQVPVQSHDVPLPPGEEKDASFNGSASMISDNHSADQL